MRLRTWGLHLKLDSTKTSGPSRRNRWLHGYVAAKAWLTEPTWLSVGEELWAEEGMAFDRDYLVPMPNEAFDGASKKMATAADAAILSEILLELLAWPRLLEIDRAIPGLPKSKYVGKQWREDVWARRRATVYSAWRPPLGVFGSFDIGISAR